MKTLVIYYSYTGKTKIIAERKAAEESAELLELTLIKRRGNFITYTAGSFAAIFHKKAKLNPFDKDLTQFERFIIAMPIWAGNPAPAINNILPLIPKNSEVELIFTSGSGNSGKSGKKTTKTLAAINVTISSVTDIKASSIQ